MHRRLTLAPVNIPQELSLEMELPMVLVTRALLSLRFARQTLAARSAASINRAVLSLQRAAGCLEHAAALLERSPPVVTTIPELSREMLRALSGFCCALVRCTTSQLIHRRMRLNHLLLSFSLQAQQLAIVRAVLLFDKPYSKMVLLTLHAGCESGFRDLEDALQPHFGPLASFAAFFGRLHGAQAYELAGEIEYMDTGIGEGIAYTLLAEQSFQERSRSDASSLGLPVLSTISASIADGDGGGGDKFESLARTLLTAKRDRLAARAREWQRGNDSAHFALVPPTSELLASPLPRVALIKSISMTGGRFSEHEHESDDDEARSDEGEDHEDDDFECIPQDQGTRSATELRVGPTEIDLGIALGSDRPRSAGDRTSTMLRRSTEPGESALAAGELRASIIRAAPLPAIEALTVMPEGRTSFVASTASHRPSIAEREALAATRVHRELLEGKRVWRLNKYRKVCWTSRTRGAWMSSNKALTDYVL